MHNVTSILLGKRRDQYGVKFFFPVLKLDSDATVVIGMLMRSHTRKKAKKRKAEATKSLRVRAKDNRVRYSFSFLPFGSLLNSFIYLFTYFVCLLFFHFMTGFVLVG